MLTSLRESDHLATLDTQALRSTHRARCDASSSGCSLAVSVSGQFTLPEPAVTHAPQSPDQQLLTRCVNTEYLFLALDYEGTLVPRVPRLQDAQPSARLLALLAELVHVPHVAVAILSERSVHDVCALLPVAGLTYIGTRGAELRTPGGAIRLLLPLEAVHATLNSLQSAVLPLVGSIPGLTLERKQYGLALHSHLATAADSERMMQAFQTIVDTYQQKEMPIAVVRGKNVVTVRPTGISKRQALRTLLAETDPAQLLLYIGEDMDDEDAFREVNTLGVSVVVADPPRVTRAQYSLPNAEAVLAFLSQLVNIRLHAG